MDLLLSRKKQFYLDECDIAHIPDEKTVVFQCLSVLLLFTVIENYLSTSVHVEGRGFIRNFSTFVHKVLELVCF